MYLRPSAPRWLGLLIVAILLGCASYQTRVLEGRNLLAEGKPQEASLIFKGLSSEEGKDQVLYLLDYGLALHQLGDYAESNKIFIEVDRLAEVKDYISLGRQAGSLFLSESLIQYKSERFENLLINAYLALNFTLENDFENALVECRRIDEKLRALRLENEDPRKSFYARYLSAMVWEAEGNWDSAYIDYKNAYDIDPSAPYIGEDLIRSAWRAQRGDALSRWIKAYPQVKVEQVKKAAKEEGELVFIYQQGWIPRKHPRPENFRFPYLVPVQAGFQRAYIKVGERAYPKTESLYNVGAEAIRTLNADFGYLVTKKILGVVAKEVMADQIRQKNKALGDIALLAMTIADQADLRQWSTLPATFQISRINLPPGEHKVQFYAVGPAGETLVGEETVQIRRGKKTFVTKRTFF